MYVWLECDVEAMRSWIDLYDVLHIYCGEREGDDEDVLLTACDSCRQICICMYGRERERDCGDWNRGFFFSFFFLSFFLFVSRYETALKDGFC